MRNIMLLDDKEGGLVYVSKDTYDQALMLAARYDGNPARVPTVIQTPKTMSWINNPDLKNMINRMEEIMPEPINMLAPFLIYTVNTTGLKYDKENAEMAYGILHQYSQLINFNAITTVPAQVRNDLSFPATILLSYKASWDALCATLADYVVAMPVAQVSPVQVEQPKLAVPPAITSRPATPVAEAIPNIGSTEEPEAEDEDDKYAVDADEMAAIFAEIEAAPSDVKKDDKPASSTPSSAASSSGGIMQTEQQKRAEEVQKSNDILDEFSMED